MAETATEARPLTAAEKRQLADLLARDQAGQAPGVRVGDPYIALTNLSLPRRGDPEHQCDLVLAGETVYLTEAEAAKYMRHGVRDGRQVAVVRPATGPGSSKDLPTRVHPRAVSGRLNGPPADARPDPAGSSALQVMETAAVPEATEPAPGTENSSAVDAEDIIPDRVRQRARATRE